MDQKTKTTIPVHNATVRVAFNERGEAIGVELICLFEHNQINDLPDMFRDSAYHVLDKYVRKPSSS